MTLSCSTGRNISITKAQWGKYALTCSNCCPPHPQRDCTVDMETKEPDLFGYIKNQCDGKQTCDLGYIAFLLNDCELEYFADYLQTFYDCLPFDTTEPIGFSAKLNGNVILNQYEIIPFDDVLSNFGGHYSTKTYSFTCPVHGVYTFSLALNQYNNDQIQAILYQNSNELIRSLADNGVYRNSATSTVIIECNAGDQVFVSVNYGGYFDGVTSPCHFTGYLLHQL